MRRWRLSAFVKTTVSRQKIKTIVFEGPNQNATSKVADFVLPSAVYAEKDGTFTNFEGRVQRIRQVLEPLGDSKPTWKILMNLGVLLGLPWKFTKPEEIFLELARTDPVFRDLDYKKLGDRGTLWKL